jgi:dethiobiotin synthetase/adenosylmethionine--8-amino-7-oxononanoate aminotransferase
MFPQSAHAPALALADRLLAGPGAGWASRVFYSDDGSTATEIALKMALRLYASRRGGALEPAHTVPPRVLALSGSYHGDTLGAACAGAPSVYNAPRQAPWYSPRALILEPATVSMTRDGAWQVSQAGSAGGEGEVFATRELLFSPGRDASPLVERYRAAISQQLDRAARESPVAGEVAAAIIEPLLHGAGGMVFIDPAFQRALATVCQSRGIPVIADEVFSGLWRLGAPGACQLLGIVPDVACYAKLLTGGTVPLAATLAGEHVFDAFRGAHKTDALLHGHSYSGHAIGCAAAVEALDALGDPARNLNLVAAAAHGLRLRELWCPARTAALAAHPSVQRSLCLGTVFAAELVASSPGYASHAAQDVVRRLRGRGVYARPIGNVVYLMVSPMAQPHTCDRLLDALTAELGAPATEHGRGGVVC